MSLPLAIGLYFVIWWTILFAVLPWGVRSQHEAGELTPGTEPAAPVRPHLAAKAIATSLLAAVLLGLVQLALINRDWLFRG